MELTDGSLFNNNTLPSDDVLNELGREGWQLASDIVDTKQDAGATTVPIFERPA